MKSLPRIVLNLFLLFHVVCVVVGVFANRLSSELTRRIVGTVSLYSRAVNIDPTVPVDFHLTHAIANEDDHRFEVEFPSGNVIRLPDATGDNTGGRSGFQYRRFRDFARQAAFAASLEDDHAMAEYARCIGDYFLSDENPTLVLRLLAYQPMDWREPVTRNLDESLASEYFVPIYQADVWRNKSGTTSVHKRVPSGEAAPLRPTVNETSRIRQNSEELLAASTAGRNLIANSSSTDHPKRSQHGVAR